MAKSRHDFDRYETDAKITQALLRIVPVTGHVLEPCAGNGLMADELKSRPFITKVTTNDIDEAMSTDMHFDATKGLFWPECDYVVTNPPFSVAPDIARNALKTASLGVCLHLRLSFYEPCKNRRDLLTQYADNMMHLIPINPRGNWRTDTSSGDSVTTAWFVWRHDWSWQAAGTPNPFRFITDWKE